MTAAAARMRRLRSRRAAGLVPLQITVPIDRVVLALEQEGFLAEWDEGDPAEVARALERMIAAWITTVIA